MEVALRRRLAGVADVTISQSRQTAAVTFASGTYVFSGLAFTEAVAEAEVDVLSLEVDVCGMIDDRNVMRSSTGQGQAIVHLRGGGFRAGSPICVTGRLEESSKPPGLEVTSLP
jgi:hypothetical protein